MLVSPERGHKENLVFVFESGKLIRLLESRVLISLQGERLEEKSMCHLDLLLEVSEAASSLIVPAKRCHCLR